MKQFLVRKKSSVAALLLAGMLFAVPAPCFAASRSVSARVSCTVVPMIEITSQTLQAHSNLRGQFLSSESLVDRGGQKVRLVSVTAL